MEIVNLIGRDSLSPEQRESYMSESSLLRAPRSPILALHHAIIGGRTSKRNSISFIVGAHAGEGAASRHASLEVVNVRRLQARTSRLIVTAILIQPRNRIRIRAAVRGH